MDGTLTAHDNIYRYSLPAHHTHSLLIHTRQQLDASDTWSLQNIVRIPYTRHVAITNASVRETTDCPPVSSIIKTRRLRFFGHVARSDSRQDHHRAVSASLRPPRDWRRPRGHPRTTWLREIDAVIQSVNTGIHSAWRKANDCVHQQKHATEGRESLIALQPRSSTELGTQLAHLARLSLHTPAA